MDIRFERKWSMPSGKTFTIKPIKELIVEEIDTDGILLDPFANNGLIQYSFKPKIEYISNDLDTQYETTHHLDALDFLKKFEDESIDFVLYDPPYSPRQVSECYKKLDMTVNMETTQSSYWTYQRREIARVLKQGGKVINFGWNSCGIGKKLGFEITRIMLVSHGGGHNDTIVTVETKLPAFKIKEIF